MDGLKVLAPLTQGRDSEKISKVISQMGNNINNTQKLRRLCTFELTLSSVRAISGMAPPCLSSLEWTTFKVTMVEGLKSKFLGEVFDGQGSKEGPQREN